MPESDTKPVSELKKNLLNGADITTRRDAALQLGMIKDHTSIPALIDSLNDHEDVVIFSTFALVKIGQACAKHLIQKGLTSQHPRVRGYTAEILGELEINEAIISLIDLIENDEDPWVRNNAIEALGRIKSPDTVDLLKTLLKSENVSVIVTASLALYRMNIQNDLTEILMQRFCTASEKDRGMIAWTLIEICDQNCIEELTKYSLLPENQHLKTEIKEIIQGIKIK